MSENEVPMILLPLEVVTAMCNDLLQMDRDTAIELGNWPVAQEFICAVASTAS